MYLNFLYLIKVLFFISTKRENFVFQYLIITVTDDKNVYEGIPRIKKMLEFNKKIYETSSLFVQSVKDRTMSTIYLVGLVIRYK